LESRLSAVRERGLNDLALPVVFAPFAVEGFGGTPRRPDRSLTPMLRMLATEMLEDAGHTVMAFDTAEQAIAYATIPPMMRAPSLWASTCRATSMGWTSRNTFGRRGPNGRGGDLRP
jgi:hypothetical protein